MARWDEATIDDRKIVDYLLSPEHPIGGDKAGFFIAVGYSPGAWTRLRDDLLSIAHSGQTVSEDSTAFGNKYVRDGVVETPARRMIGLRTIWISDEPDDPPRLVTAYPA